MNQFLISQTLSAVDRHAAVKPLDAFLIALIGLAIVFAVLIILMFVIWLMGFIAVKSPMLAAKYPKATQNIQKIKDVLTLKALRDKKKPVADNSAEALIDAAAEAEKANGSAGDLVLVNVSERDAAMIMAIVADSTSTPINQLRFKSIKLVEDGGQTK